MERHNPQPLTKHLAYLLTAAQRKAAVLAKNDSGCDVFALQLKL
jgi:hypothetical protein